MFNQNDWFNRTHVSQNMRDTIRLSPNDVILFEKAIHVPEGKWIVTEDLNNLNGGILHYHVKNGYYALIDGHYPTFYQARGWDETVSEDVGPNTTFALVSAVKEYRPQAEAYIILTAPRPPKERRPQQDMYVIPRCVSKGLPISSA